MLHRLCGSPSIPLSFTLAGILPRRHTHRVCSGTHVPADAWCASFTVRTTRVSKPVCSPHLRASASVHGQPSAFASGVLPDIYRFHPYTWNSDDPSCTPAWQFQAHHGVGPRTFTPGLPRRLRTACAPFTPNDSEQRSPPTYYRGCWHVVSRGLFRDSRHRGAIPCLAHSPSRKGLYNLTAFIVHAASLRQTFVHCGRSLAAASRRSLGRSQSQCGRPPSQAGYPSSPWWALTPPTS